MNFDAYRTAWRAEGATPHTPLREELENMIKNMVRSERRSRIVLVACAINTAVAALLVSGIILFRRPIVWDEAAPVFTLQLILAFGLAWLIRRRQRRRRALESAVATVREATETGLTNVKSEIRDAQVLLWLACVAIPLFAVAVNELISSGKMNTQSALSFGILLAAVIGINAAVIWRKHRRILVPQRRRMEQILASIQDAQ